MSQMSGDSASSISRVFAPTFLTTNKKQDLLKNLIDLSAVLGAISQDPTDRPRGLQLIANQIVSTRLIGHSDKDVRLLASCCAVDILRIYAPEAPYTDEELLRIFKVVVNQIRGIATSDISSGSGAKMFYILTSLSVVKSCVVLVSLTKNGLQGADELLLDLFDALITTIRQDHPNEVGAHMGSVLQACLEEMENVEQDILELLLQPLLPNNKADNPAAYILCQSVLRRTAQHMDPFISNLVNQSLVNWADRDKSSALNENIYALIYELHKISANLLLRILPNICVQLQVEDEDARLKAVKLLGKLFASPHAEYGAQFSRNFREFLGRSNDVSTNIRLEVITSCTMILRKKPVLREVCEETVCKKLRDVDGDVRLAAATGLVEIGTEDPLLLSGTTYQEIGERMKDKKPELRRQSMAGLAKVYSKHVAGQFPALGSEKQDTRRLSNYLDRLDFVPRYILSCWGYPDMSTKLAVVQALQESLLPSEKPVGLSQEPDEILDTFRASALLFLFKSLNGHDRSILASILAMKAKVRSELQNFLNSRVSYQTSKSNEALDVMKQHIYALMAVLAPTDKKSTIVDKVMVAKDKHIFRQLTKAVVASETKLGLKEALEDMRSRLDSKSALGEYFTTVFEFSQYTVANTGSVRALLEYAAYCTENEDDCEEDAILASELLNLLSKHAAPAFEGSPGGLLVWFTACTDSQTGKAVQNCVGVVKSSSVSLAKASNATELCTAIVNCSLKTTDITKCESFAEAAAALANAGVQGPVLSALKSLSTEKKLAEGNKRVLYDMTALAAMLVNCPDIAIKAVNTDRILSCLKESVLSSSPSSSLSSDVSIQVVCAAMKLWSSVCYILEKENDDVTSPMMHIGDDEKENYQSTSHLKQETADLLGHLFECLASNGSIFFNIEFDEEADCHHLRETAAMCELLLLQIKEVGKNLDVMQWHSLGWSLLDQSSSTRRLLMNELNKLIQTHVVHPRILALPCLLATDDALSDAAEKALLFAVRRLRRTHQGIRDQAVNSTDSRILKIAEDTMPETMLPYALHLLSHHPDFPSSAKMDDEQDKRRMKAVMKSLSMVLNVLLDSAYTAGDNLSYLFKQVHMITRYYTDKIDPGNLGLDFVTRLTRKLLNEKIRSAESVQSYPGDISLPMDLYELCGEDEAAAHSVAAESALDQAISALGGLKKRPGGSPQKASRPVKPMKEAEKKVVEKKAKVSKPVKSRKVTREADEEKEEEDNSEDELKHRAVLVVDRPTRSGRLVKTVKYTEVGEDEREVSRWNDDAGAVQKPRKSSTGSSSGKVNQENVFDFEATRPAVAKRSPKKKSSVELESPEDSDFGATRVLKDLGQNKRQKKSAASL